MALAAAPDPEQAGGCVYAAWRPGARPSPQPRQGHLLHRHVRGERSGSALSQAQVFARGQYPALGRFNLATADPNAADATVRVRGMGLQISTPDGQEWRTAMIDAPVFPVSTPQAFYELLLASGSKDPNAMKTFAAAHPEFAAFGAWAKRAPWTGSYAEERYNSLNSFIFADNAGAEHAVRWSLVPAAQPVPVSPDELAKRGPNFLEQEITERVARRAAALDHGGDRRQSRRSDRGPDQGLAGGSPHGRGRDAHRAADRSRARTAHAATSTSIRPFCRRASGHRTIHSRPHGRPPTRSHTTVARRRPRTIPEPQRAPSHDDSRQASPRSSACCTGSWRSAFWRCCSSA